MNKTIVLFIICFITPVVVAQLALNFNWLNPAQTNRGQFVEKNYHIQNWPSESSIKWSLVTLESNQCAITCKQNKEIIKNIYDVLGKHNLRVGAFSLATLPEGIQVTNLISNQHHHLQQQQNEFPMKFDSLYLVDHRGLVVLEYPITYADEQDTKVKKGLIKDLKKLLNYSRSRA
jgi:hypothetical protein